MPHKVVRQSSLNINTINDEATDRPTNKKKDDNNNMLAMRVVATEISSNFRTLHEVYGAPWQADKYTYGSMWHAVVYSV